jgi:hypothetical protein
LVESQSACISTLKRHPYPLPAVHRNDFEGTISVLDRRHRAIRRKARLPNEGPPGIEEIVARRFHVIDAVTIQGRAEL